MSQPAADRETAPRALFRCDGSAAIGGGHLRRCLTLAEALRARGWRCAFATIEASLSVLPHLSRGGGMLPLDDTSSRSPQGEAAAIGRHYRRCDWLIIDHYGRDATFERACRPFAARLLVIDDLADRPHDCDVLLDQTLGRHEVDYRGLVPQHCRVLTGVDHALLRPEFAQLRSGALARPSAAGPPYRVLVSMGLTDPDNLTVLALHALSACPLPIRIDVVMGAAAPHLPEVRRLVGCMRHPVGLQVDPPDLAAMMAVADLVIGAAGTSSWERCCLGRPSIALVAAGNQREIAAALSAAGAALVLSGGETAAVADLAASVLALLQDPRQRDAMGLRAAAVCDGLGAERVASVLAQCLVAPGGADQVPVG